MLSGMNAVVPIVPKEMLRLHKPHPLWKSIRQAPALFLLLLHLRLLEKYLRLSPHPELGPSLKSRETVYWNQMTKSTPEIMGPLL
jgi:hypothetical protein